MPTGGVDSQQVKNIETISDSMCFIVLHLSSLELSHNQICAANPLQEHRCSLQDLFFSVLAIQGHPAYKPSGMFTYSYSSRPLQYSLWRPGPENSY